MPHDPAPYVFGRRIPEDAVWEHYAHPSARPEPFDAALDEQHFGRHCGLITLTADVAPLLLLPLRGKLVATKDCGIGDWYVRPERRVRHQHVDRAKRNLLGRLLDAFEVTSGERQRIYVENVAFRSGRHHQIHRGRADQGGVEVGAIQVRLDELPDIVTGEEAVRGFLTVRRGLGLVLRQ